MKEKAKGFGIQAGELADPSSRKDFMSKANTSAMLNEINICFKIQNLILEANDNY